MSEIDSLLRRVGKLEDALGNAEDRIDRLERIVEILRKDTKK
jgi:hypothetical protein|tara:strand:+ start:255 stop:380 length:126 start_codon:yes stop_codon:yes gene_type:complete